MKFQEPLPPTFFCTQETDYPLEEFTFSIELEFLFENQFDHQWGTSPTHDDHLCKALENVFCLDTNWKLEKVADRFFHNGKGPFHVYELRISDSRKYFLNQKEDWQALKKTLSQVQQALPLGFWSAHFHIGHVRAVDESGRLKVDPKYFGAIVKVFEGMWYALSGYDYDFFRSREFIIGTFGLGFIENLRPFAELKPTVDKLGIFHHRGMLNLSCKYPTMEVRTLSGLLGKNPAQQFLNIEQLKQDTQWIFALLSHLLKPDRK